MPGGSGIGVTCKAPGQGGAVEIGHRATARAWTAPICISTHLHLSHPRPFSLTHTLPLPALPGNFYTWHSDHLFFFPIAVLSLSKYFTNIVVQRQKSCTLHILRGECVSPHAADVHRSLSAEILVTDSPAALRNPGPQSTLLGNLFLLLT